MNKRTCTMPECNRAHRARGLCASHYNQAHAPDSHAKKLVPCAFCGTEVLKYSGGSKARRPVCSTQCREWLNRPYCVLPADHWARWYGKASAWTPPPPKVAAPKTAKACTWCGYGYETYQPHSLYCTQQCAKRASRLRRRASEHGATGTYTWAQVIRLFMAANKLCADCDVRIDGQPDPDHVTPLSRGGRNDIGNIVACCRACNADKSDLTLSEWADERARLGKPARRYSLPFYDPRFRHLTLDPASGSAHRHRAA